MPGREPPAESGGVSTGCWRNWIGIDRTHTIDASLLLRCRAFAPGYRLPQDELDLGVHAAQIIRRPFLDLLPQFRRDPKQKRFARFPGHDQVYRVPVLITGDASEFPHNTTSRLLTMAALRSSSSLTTFLRSRSSSAI